MTIEALALIVFNEVYTENCNDRPWALATLRARPQTWRGRFDVTEGRERAAVLDVDLDERLVARVLDAVTEAPVAERVHDTVARVVEIAERDPDGTREALWILRGQTDALAALENGLGLSPGRATLALGGAIQLASAELASPDPDLRSRMPELVRWLEGAW